MALPLGLDKRTEILARSLMIENLTSSFIGGLLGIKDVRNSRTLGNKSSSLSFNQKIDLLIDLGALDSTQRNKFLTFMEIRNQFMHNLSAASYCECFDFLEGKEKFIFKLYPQDVELSKEDQLEKASLQLASDTLTLTAEITESVKAKFLKDIKGETHELSNKAFIASIAETKKMIDQLTESIIAKQETISTKELKDLGDLVSTIIGSNWQKLFKEYTK